jgi:hypothetical protein
VLQKTGGIKKNHIVAPQEQLRLNLVNQLNTNTNIDKLSSLTLKTNFNVLNNTDVNLLNKNNFYFFNNNLIDYTNKLQLKKSL